MTSGNSTCNFGYPTSCELTIGRKEAVVEELLIAKSGRKGDMRPINSMLGRQFYYAYDSPISRRTSGEHIYSPRTFSGG
jgi:hypothetical protein